MVKQSRLFDSKLQAENNRLRQRVSELETTLLDQRVREQTHALQQEIDRLRGELRRYQGLVDGRASGSEGAQAVQPSPDADDAQSQASSLLREWEQFIEHINDANPVVLYLYNFSENRILYSNNEIARLLGYSLDEISAMGANLFPHLIHPDDAAKLPAHLRALQDRSPGEVCEFEYRMKHKNGSWRWFYSRDVVTNLDGAGRPLEGIGIANEVTQRKLAEEKLRNQAYILQNVPDAIISTDASFHITHWNLSAERIYGWKEHEVTGKLTAEVLKTSFLGETSEGVMKEFLTNGRWEGETKQVRKDGGAVYIHSSVTQLLDAAGMFVGAVAINRDITEIKTARAAVRESEARFQAIFDSAVVGIALVSIPQGIAVQTNARLQAMLGYSQSELEAMSFTDVTHPEDLKIEWPLYQEFVLGRRSQYQVEKRLMRKDGSFFWARLNVFPIEASSQRLGVRIVEDITERKKAEEALHAANRFNLEVINGAGEGVVVFDRELRYQVWNPFMEKLTGFKAGEVLNHKAIEIFPIEEPKIARLEQVLAGKSISSPDFSFKSPRMEKPVWISATYSPYLDMYGNVVGIISTVRDVTERVQADMMRQEIEILRNMDRFRDELISNVSHEMRNPLGLILVMVTALLRNTESIDAATLLEFLKDIEQETRNLQAIVDNLLDASRLQSGRMRLQRKSADLGKIVQRVVRLAAEQAADHTIQYHLPEGSLLTVMDAKRIEQVLRNILDNAVKYSSSGGRIDVTMLVNQGFYQVEVSDDGPGIPADERERIFERFYRGLETGGKAVPGVGLGLPISRSIIEAHEGKLWVADKLPPETGSVFIFTLPIKIDPNPATSGDWPDEF
jgi:PAS domain S-box-containing protein